MSDETTKQQSKAVAIIGFAGRFPGAANAAEFWQNLRCGVESIRKLTDDELRANGVSEAALRDPHYVKACPVLDDLDKFDAAFFGFSPREASVMDPAHRLFLEVSVHALEHAGYTGLADEGKVAVFATSGAPLYMMEHVRTHPGLMKSMGDFLVRHTGNDMSFLSTRVSYELDLRGASVNVQTACSSALVAVHMACQSLLRGEAQLALAGGATVLFPHGQGYEYRDGEILSPDGHCRPFDAKSAGTVFGSGVGCVVLKRLEDALDDGDTIHAVIRGGAINNDGALKVGYLAPGVDGQADCVDAALRDAGVPVESISYVETHGTGTLVGDPIELEGLTQAFSRHTQKKQFCAVGSVKSNIGHLGEAAGVASLIKAVMALSHRELPPSLGYETPNPQIDFEAGPFFVNSKLTPWLAKGPRRCGITALGAGGTNCHLVLEEAPPPLPGDGAREQQLFLLSAKSRDALERRCKQLAVELEQRPELDLADAAYTLSVGRRAMPHRRALSFSTREEAVRLLKEGQPSLVSTAVADELAPKVAFLFPGGGAQYAGLGQDLYASEESYRDAVDTCLGLLEPKLGSALRSLMFAGPEQREQASRELERPSYSVCSIFITEYALTKLFAAWGLHAHAAVGHSMGEYVAACLASVMSVEDALRLVVLRGQLFEAVEAGGMLSVPLAEAELRALMPVGLDIAAVNAPELCVASGPVLLIQKLEAILTDRGIEHTRVRINVAAHSAMLEPILGRFRELCRLVKLSPPSLPFVSNLTGKLIRAEEATDPEYWVSHLRGTVRFGDCIETLLSLGSYALIELGPGRTLSTLARAGRLKPVAAVSSMRHPSENVHDVVFAMASLGKLWTHGVALDFAAFYDGQLRNRIPLPVYPFERTSFWLEKGKTVESTDGSALLKRARIEDWFYSLQFAQSPRIEKPKPEVSRYLVFSNGSRLVKQLIERLRQHAQVDVVVQGLGESMWEMVPSRDQQFIELFQALETKDILPDHVIYTWSAVNPESPQAILPTRRAEEDLTRAIQESFYGPLFLTRLLGGRAVPMRLTFLSHGSAQTSRERLDPVRAMVLGPTLVAPREFPQLDTRCIDITTSLVDNLRSSAFVEQLVEELRSQTSDRFVALRPGLRFVPKLDSLPLPAPEDAASYVREGAVVLITGGLGGIGLEVARQMAKRRKLRFALLSRSELPPEAEFPSILAQGGRAAVRIQALLELRALGSEVLVVAGDVTQPESLERALRRVRSELGPINFVIHAAGVMHDEPMQSKNPLSIQKVLSPKVQGTLHLDALIDEPLDAFVIFSSVASFLGLPGQVDYTAANAFLDAFARKRSQSAKGRTVVINWNAWRDVGMAESSHRSQKGQMEVTARCQHPLLDGYNDDGISARTYVTDFSVKEHWLLSEHQIKDSYALLSGTTFVELTRAAFQTAHGPAPMEINQLSFLSPFQVGPDETRRLFVDVKQAGDAYEVVMRSTVDPRTPPHVIGDARRYTGPKPPPADLTVLRQRMPREERTADGFLRQQFVSFGPRWANIVLTRYGVGEALIELALPQRFEADLEHLHVHPALLDMATGGVQALIPGIDLEHDFYVPVAYGRILVFDRMPREVFSHVRCRPETGRGLAYFDVTLYDGKGTPFLEINRFTMKRLDAASGMTRAVSKTAQSKAARAASDPMEQLLREAIAPHEGVEAFERIMCQPGLGQVVASSVDVNRWLQNLDAPLASALDDAGGEGFARPNLASDYAEPTTEGEKMLARLWSELLGIKQVGIKDDFFDLGGNSLTAVRLFATIKKELDLSLPLSTLFETPTIEKLAKLVDAAVSATQEASHASAEVAPRKDAYAPVVAMQPGGERPAFFCAAGMGGNPLNLRSIAMLVGFDQPFYGLQPRGLDGESALHDSVEEMASYYLQHIKEKQPQGPYYLGGYSAGGIAAFEMARQLRAQGEEVGCVVLLDTYAPALPTRTRSERLELHVQRLREQGVSYLAATAGRRLRAELGRLEKLARKPAENLLAPRATFEAIGDNWVRLVNAYRPEPYPGEVFLLCAADRPESGTQTALESGDSLGWAPYVTGTLEVSACPGNHFTICEDPHVRVLARRLRGYLDRRMGERGDLHAEVLHAAQ